MLNRLVIHDPYRYGKSGRHDCVFPTWFLAVAAILESNDVHIRNEKSSDLITTRTNMLCSLWFVVECIYRWTSTVLVCVFVLTKSRRKSRHTLNTLYAVLHEAKKLLCVWYFIWWALKMLHMSLKVIVFRHSIVDFLKSIKLLLIKQETDTARSHGKKNNK